MEAGTVFSASPPTPSKRAVSVLRAYLRVAMLLELGDSEASGSKLRAIDDLPGSDLLAAILRHRVPEVMLMHSDNLRLPADLTRVVRTITDEHRLHCMIQAHETLRATNLLHVAGIRTLLLKGAALAVQTTGDFTARGVGDIDLWVEVNSVSAARKVLESSGWEVDPNMYPAAAETWAWRFFRDTNYELSLKGSVSSIDLHWQLGPVRGSLADFDTAWRRRASISLGEQRVETLNPADALEHTCAHAAKDDWRWLRSLVDVHRLSRLPHAWDNTDAGDFLSRITIATLLVTEAAVGLPETALSHLREGRAPRRALRRLRTAERTQTRPVPTRDRVPGTHLLGSFSRSVRGASGPSDVARVTGQILSGPALVGIRDRSALTGVPKAALRRAQQARTRVKEYRQGRG